MSLSASRPSARSVPLSLLAVVALVADESHGFDATAKRLLRNQRDIGNAIKPFYGTAAGDRLTRLLDHHITIAVELLQAAKAGDKAKVNHAASRWYANANDIADYEAVHAHILEMADLLSNGILRSFAGRFR